MTTKEELINELMDDKAKFDALVYTPWREVVKELEVRENDVELASYLTKVLPANLDQTLTTGKNMALARHLATPNYEMYRFVQCADVISELRPIILEYLEDKYVNASELKYALAELKFYRGVQANTLKPILDKKAVINRNESNGQKINKITTSWGESFVDFHRTFFNNTFPELSNNIYDLSEMYKQCGGIASLYYKSHLALFLRNNVLFENYLFSKEESDFMRNRVLPNFIDIIIETGKKPLIVNLGPTGNEDDVFWISYPPSKAEVVNTHIQNFCCNLVN